MRRPFGQFQPDEDTGGYTLGIYSIEREGRLWVVFGHGWHKPDRISSHRSLREAHYSLTGASPDRRK
jgi:hypothetical protein